MDTTFAAAAGLCLLGLAIRSSYERLKEAGKADPTNPAVFALVFAAMCVMLVSWPVMAPRDPWRLDIPGAVRWTGLLAQGAALALALGALAQLRAFENVDHLVTTGLFLRLRHPMYMGFLLWIGGCGLRAGAPATLLLGAVAAANILYWRRLEEAALEARYGEVYRRYRERTWC